MYNWMQTNFSGGEISNRYKYQIDETEHAKSLEEAYNVVIRPQGSIERRVGFDHVYEFPAEVEAIRLFDFNINFSDSICVAATDEFIQLFDRNGPLSGLQMLVNSTFSAGGSSWLSAKTVFALGLAKLAPTNNIVAYVQQTFDTEIGTTYKFRVDGARGACRYLLGSTPGAGDILDITSSAISEEFEFVATTASTTVRCQISTNNAIKYIDRISVVNTSSGEGGNVIFGTPWTLFDIVGLQYAMAPGKKEMYFVHRNHPPYLLSFEGGVWSFGLVEFIFGDDGANPPIPDFPPWDPENQNQHPGSIDFHQGRMVLGGTYNDPVTLWLSRPQTADQTYRDFSWQDTTETPEITPGDPLVLPLDKHGEISWIKSNRTLLVGLDTGEHIVFGFNGAIDVDDAQTEQHSAYGSSRILPVNIGSSTLFVDTEAKRIRKSNYEREREAWVPYDLLYRAEHISQERISELRHGTSPDGFIIAPLLNGNILFGTIEQDLNVMAWGTWQVFGDTQSVTTLKEFGTDVIWAATKIVSDFATGETSIRLLRQPPIWTSLKLYMDHAIELFNTPGEAPKTSWSGAESLRNQYCNILVDGVPHPGVVVAADGTFEVNVPCNNVRMGLVYISRIVTLPPNQLDRAGFTHVHKKRFSDVWVRIASRRPNIINEITYERSADTNMGLIEPDRNEWISVVQKGFDRDQSIKIVSTDPWPLLIYAIGGKLEENRS